MTIRIKEVETKKELKTFVTFANKLYKDNPYYIPEIGEEVKMTLSREKNPAFEFCEAIYYLAYKKDQPVGRIAGIINHKSNEKWNQKYVRFAFVDFIDDAEVVDALFDQLATWGKSKGMDHIQGPMGFTDMDKEGMLIEGFEELGTMATIYNHPYYPKHMERLGFIKEHDWHEYKIYIPEDVPDKHRRIAEIVQKKYGLRTLKFKNRKEVYPYAHKIFETLNKAYEPLYGFASLTPKQIDYYVAQYIPMIQLDLVSVIIREEDNEVVGFGISLPSLSRALQKSNGKLFPFGFIHLLKGLKGKPKIVDLYLVGILPEYQKKGVNALIFNDLIPYYIQLGVKYAESNPESEQNDSIHAQWDYFKTEMHKTRRAFVKEIK